jgi:hypothetical protein
MGSKRTPKRHPNEVVRSRWSLCALVKKFPYHMVADGDLDFDMAFDAATDLVEVACTEYIPG